MSLRAAVGQGLLCLHSHLPFLARATAYGCISGSWGSSSSTDRCAPPQLPAEWCTVPCEQEHRDALGGRMSVSFSAHHTSSGEMQGTTRAAFPAQTQSPMLPRQGHVYSQGQIPPQPRALLHRIPPPQSRAHGLEALSALKSGLGLIQRVGVAGVTWHGPPHASEQAACLNSCLAHSHHPAKPSVPGSPRRMVLHDGRTSWRNPSPVPGGSSRT